MITVMRKQLKSPVFRFIIWTFLLAFAIFLVGPNLFDRLKTPQWVAEVDGQTIGYKAFVRAIAKHEYNIRTIREQYGPYADMFMQMLGLDQDPKVVAFEQLVQETILNKVVKNIPLYVHADYIGQKFNDPTFVQKSGLYDVLPVGVFTAEGINEDALRYYLARVQLNITQFESLIEQALARYIVLELAGIGAYVPRETLNDAQDRALLKRKYTILKLSLDNIIKEEKQKSISDDELKTFFETQNKRTKRYWIPEKRAGTVWTFNPQQYGITISDDAIQDYYDRNKVKKYIETPAQVQVRRILIKPSETEPTALTKQRAAMLHAELLNAPDTFGSKARELSDDDESAKNEGLLPFFAKGEHEKIFERTSFLLRKDGDISDVFESSEGFEIVQRVEKKRVLFKPLSEVKKEIKGILERQQFSKQFANDMKRIIDPTGLDEQKLALFIKERKASSSKQELAQKDESRLMQTLFKLKNNEANFFIEGDSGYIVQLDEVKKRHLPDLENIKSTVQADLVEDRAQKKLQQIIKNAKNALRTDSIQKVAKTFGASVQTTDFIESEDEDAIDYLKKQGVPTYEMLQLEKKDAIKSIIQDDGYIFYVSDVSDPATEVDQEKILNIRRQVYDERKSLFVQGFVASLSRNATIKTNKSLFTLSETRTI